MNASNAIAYAGLLKKAEKYLTFFFAFFAAKSFSVSLKYNLISNK